ncbi:hypothetical protein RFI_37029, partial [Reticulomyxa filosa]
LKQSKRQGSQRNVEAGHSPSDNDTEPLDKTSIAMTIRHFSSLQQAPHKRLPSQMQSEPWNVELQGNLKSVLNAHSNLRVNIAAKADKLMMDCFVYRDKNQKYEAAELLLDVWRKIMDEINAMIDNGIKSQAMSKMCEVMFAIVTRYEWDLTHIEHWVLNSDFQPMTTQVWSKKMHRYYKQLEHTVNKTKQNKTKQKKKRKVLEWIEEEKELDEGRHKLAINMLGLACMRISPLHKPIMTHVLKDWERQVKVAKWERCEYLIKFFSEDGKAPITWQQEYELELAQKEQCLHSLELYFSQDNPSAFLEAWKCFASDNSEKLSTLSKRQREFLQSNAQEIVSAMFGDLARRCHGMINWTVVPGFSMVSKVFVQGLIWSKVGSDLSNRVIKAITRIFENVPRMANQLGVFCSALLRNTDAMHPDQVQLCFDTIREWIGILERHPCEPLNGLLPDSWCHEMFIESTTRILQQDDYQVVCVLLTFILHHAHLFQDGLRLVIIKGLFFFAQFTCALCLYDVIDILIKEYFQALFCHWNPIVRKYFHWVMLYTTNRLGYHSDDSYEDMKESKSEVCEIIQKIRMMFNHVYQTLNKKFCFFAIEDFYFYQIITYVYSFANRSAQPKIVSKFLVPKKDKIELKEEKKDEDDVHSGSAKEKRTEYKGGRKDEKIIWRYVNMNIRQRVDTDYDILMAFSVEIMQLHKQRTSIPDQYQRYIKTTFYEFLEACNEYKEVQLSKTPHRLGDIAIPTRGYHVLTKKDLDEKDKIS